MKRDTALLKKHAQGMIAIQETLPQLNLSRICNIYTDFLHWTLEDEAAFATGFFVALALLKRGIDLETFAQI